VANDGSIRLPAPIPIATPAPIEAGLDWLLSHISGGPFGIFDGVRTILRDLLHPVAKWADDAINVVFDLAFMGWAWIGQLAGDALDAVHWAYNTAKADATAALGYAAGALTYAIGVVDAAWHAGISFASTLLNQAISAVDAAWHAGLSFSNYLLNQAISAVDAAWHAGINAASWALNQAISAVDAAWHAGINAASWALNQSISAVDAAWHAGLSFASTALHDLIAGVEWAAKQALKLVEDTVLNPLFAEWHLFKDHLLPDVIAAIDVIRKCWDWLIRLAEVAFTDTSDAARSLGGWEVSAIGDRARSVYTAQRPHLARMSRAAS